MHSPFASLTLHPPCNKSSQKPEAISPVFSVPYPFLTQKVTRQFGSPHFNPEHHVSKTPSPLLAQEISRNGTILASFADLGLAPSLSQSLGPSRQTRSKNRKQNPPKKAGWGWVFVADQQGRFRFAWSLDTGQHQQTCYASWEMYTKTVLEVSGESVIGNT